MFVALIALIVSLTGTAAAARFVITSSSQVKPGSLEVKNLSTKARAALRGQQGPAGPAGAPGTAGPAGSQGAAGPSGQFSAANVTLAAGALATMCPSGTPSSGGVTCEVGASDAKCPSGGIALSGGWAGGKNPPVNSGVGYNQPGY